jgi:hypothetical protein
MEIAAYKTVKDHAALAYKGSHYLVLLALKDMI